MARGIPWGALSADIRSQIAHAPRKQIHVSKHDAANNDWLYDTIPDGQLFHTPHEGLANLQSHQDLIIHYGEWTLATALEFTTSHLDCRLLGSDIGRGRAHHGTILYGTEALAMINGDGSAGLEIAGLTIYPDHSGATGSAATTSYGIILAASAHTHRCWIHDCDFVAGATTYGPVFIQAGMNESSWRMAQSLVIDNCHFMAGGCHGAGGGDRAQINMHRADGFIIDKCSFLLWGNSETSMSVDVYSNSSYFYQRAQIVNSLFMCYEVGGVKTINNENETTVGTLYVDNCHFIGQTASDNCVTYNTSTCGANYLNGALLTA